MEDSRPTAASVGWARLSWDLTEMILSYLTLTSLARAAAVCRLWRSVLSQPSFPARAASARRRCPWIFLHGLNHVLPGRNQSFAFDPEAARWFPLPPAPPLLFSGSGGYSFSSGPSGCILFAPIPVSHPWRASPTLSSPRCNPLVAVIGDPSSPRFVVVGGARYVGGLVDIEADRLDAELYDPATSEVWEPCPPLPPEFRPGLSSQWLSSALLHGRLLFFSGIYSGLVSCLDLGQGSRRAWSQPSLSGPQVSSLPSSSRGATACSSRASAARPAWHRPLWSGWWTPSRWNPERSPPCRRRYSPASSKATTTTAGSRASSAWASMASSTSSTRTTTKPTPRASARSRKVASRVAGGSCRRFPAP